MTSRLCSVVSKARALIPFTLLQSTFCTILNAHSPVICKPVLFHRRQVGAKNMGKRQAEVVIMLAHVLHLTGKLPCEAAEVVIMLAHVLHLAGKLPCEAPRGRPPDAAQLPPWRDAPRGCRKRWWAPCSTGSRCPHCCIQRFPPIHNPFEHPQLCPLAPPTVV